jgi:parallel beta-helix repeat protein
MPGSDIWDPKVSTVDVQLREDLASVLSAGLGAGLVGYDVLLGYAPNTVGAELRAQKSALTGLLVANIGGYLNVQNFGAKGDGSDDYAAIMAAYAVSPRLYFPKPTLHYQVSQTIALTQPGSELVGEGITLTQIKGSFAAGPIVSLVDGASNMALRNIAIGRTIAPDATGHGVQALGAANQCRITGVSISNQRNGIQVLGGIDCMIEDSFIQGNYGNGIQQNTNGTADGYWDLISNEIRYNDGSGIEIAAIGSALRVNCGRLVLNTCEYNTGYGIKAAGQVTKSLDDVAVQGNRCFFNGAGGIYFDTYGTGGRINSNTCNSNGTVATGRLQTTPLTNAAFGIQVLSSTVGCNITSNSANKNAYSGIYVQGSRHVIAANSCTLNGSNAAATSRHGIELATPTEVICGSNNVLGNGLSPGILISGAATNTGIAGNQGYNPKTPDDLTFTASPFTYNVGPSPETLYLYGGTISSLVINGKAIPYVPSALNTLQLGANSVVVFTFAVQPTTRARIYN